MPRTVAHCVLKAEGVTTPITDGFGNALPTRLMGELPHCPVLTGVDEPHVLSSSLAPPLELGLLRVARKKLCEFFWSHRMLCPCDRALNAIIIRSTVAKTEAHVSIVLGNGSFLFKIG